MPMVTTSETNVLHHLARRRAARAAEEQRRKEGGNPRAVYGRSGTDLRRG